MWVETQVPCMIYCGDELCTCGANWYYEALEEDEDWSILDKRAHVEKKAYATYLAKLQASNLSECRAQAAGKSKVIFISSASATVSA